MPNYSGVWTLQEQYEAVLEGNWPEIFRAELYIWGDNGDGELGLGDVNDTSSPVQVGSESDWSVVSSGQSVTSGVKTNNTLWSWGSSSVGRHGLNDSISRSSPVQIGALTVWDDVYLGGAFGVARTTSGELYSWGQDANGRLGLNTVSGAVSSPTQIGSLTDWSKISAGGSFVLATKTDNTLWAWGYNGRGNLGDGTTVDKSSPVQIGALTDWDEISAGYETATGAFCMAINSSGELYAWGDPVYGSLGLNINTPELKSSPVQVGALTNWSKVAAGAAHTLAVKSDGTLWSWGRGAFGRTGHNDEVDRSSPVQIGSDTDWADVSASYHSLALKTDGTLWAWGIGATGRMGLGDIINRSSPVQIGSLVKWSSVSAGLDHSSGLFRIT